MNFDKLVSQNEAAKVEDDKVRFVGELMSKTVPQQQLVNDWVKELSSRLAIMTTEIEIVGVILEKILNGDPPKDVNHCGRLRGRETPVT